MVLVELKPPTTSRNAGQRLEAATGFEPVYAALQAATYTPLTSTYTAPAGRHDHYVTTEDGES